MSEWGCGEGKDGGCEEVGRREGMGTGIGMWKDFFFKKKVNKF